MEIRSPAQGRPRRSPIVLISLIAILAVLAAVGTAFLISQWASVREKREYLASLAARAEAHTAANGTTRASRIAHSTGAAPTAHEVPAAGGAIEPV
ncbi:MAG TPA: hypothetical protein VHC22_28950 [Pirellulales bacterium]|nr:hypothetical protein [Pirellulales bacterium]